MDTQLLQRAPRGWKNASPALARGIALGPHGARLPGHAPRRYLFPSTKTHGPQSKANSAGSASFGTPTPATREARKHGIMLRQSSTAVQAQLQGDCPAPESLPCVWSVPRRVSFTHSNKAAGREEVAAAFRAKRRCVLGANTIDETDARVISGQTTEGPCPAICRRWSWTRLSFHP